jgi:DNA-binding NarL/FixJ family response regulator
VSDSPDRTAVLLDPHPIWLGAVTGVLERVNVTVVGTSTTIPGALALLDRHDPDLLVTETNVGGGLPAGFACIREARLRHPELRVVALAAGEVRADVEGALAAGAVAYVVKSAHPDDLASAVRQAFSHSVYLAQGNAGLTKRELEILRLVSEGHSNAQLARMLWVTEQTVKFHLSNVYRKLDVANRTEAARWAQLQGLLTVREGSIAA